MGGKSVRKAWNASDIEKVILKARKRHESETDKTGKTKKSLVDAFAGR